MGSSGLFLLFLLGTLVYALLQYARAKKRTTDATQTALFIVLYPVLLFFTFSNKPVAPWIAVPVVMMIAPWLLAGVHLNKVVENPAVTRQGDFVGVPGSFWLIGAALAVVMGFLFT